MNFSPRQRLAIAACMTIAVIALIETLRLAGFDVVVPFLTIYSTVAILAGVLGLSAGLLSALLAGIYTIHAALAGFGPPTLTGGPAQVTLGLAIVFAFVITIGRMRDNSTRLVRELRAARTDLQQQAAQLEAEVADRTLDYRRMTTRVFQVQEAERASLARELHDELGQSLVAVKMILRQLPSTTTSAAPVYDACGLLDNMIEQTRSLSLLLHPAFLDSQSLAVVIRRYVEQRARRAALDCTLELDAAPSNLSEDTMLLCYRCVQEAVTNIVKHAKARRITVVLERHDAEVHLRIEDDGDGFELPARWRVSEQGGLGVPGMAERFRLAGGEFALESSPGFGTRVLASIPIDPRNAAVA